MGTMDGVILILSGNGLLDARKRRASSMCSKASAQRPSGSLRYFGDGWEHTIEIERAFDASTTESHRPRIRNSEIFADQPQFPAKPNPLDPPKSLRYPRRSALLADDYLILTTTLSDSPARSNTVTLTIPADIGFQRS